MNKEFLMPSNEPNRGVYRYWKKKPLVKRLRDALLDFIYEPIPYSQGFEPWLYVTICLLILLTVFSWYTGALLAVFNGLLTWIPEIILTSAVSIALYRYLTKKALGMGWSRNFRPTDDPDELKENKRRFRRYHKDGYMLLALKFMLIWISLVALAFSIYINVVNDPGAESIKGPVISIISSFVSVQPAESNNDAAPISSTVPASFVQSTAVLETPHTSLVSTDLPLDPSPSSTATNTLVPSSTPSASPTVTASATLFATLTLVPTATPTASSTPTATVAPTETATLTPTATAGLPPTEIAPTSTQVATQIPTSTPLVPTSTPLPTDTPEPTESPTSTAVPTNVPLPTSTSTEMPTQVPTNTPGPTPGPTSTP